MRYRYVHLGINPMGAIAGQPSAAPPAGYPEVLQQYLNSVADDWYRYGSQNYVLWTNLDLSDLATQIVRLPGYASVYVLAIEIADPAPAGSNGWMPQQFWNWLRKPRP
jgi:hypothetical protein